MPKQEKKLTDKQMYEFHLCLSALLAQAQIQLEADAYRVFSKLCDEEKWKLSEKGTQLTRLAKLMLIEASRKTESQFAAEAMKGQIAQVKRINKNRY